MSNDIDLIMVPVHLEAEEIEYELGLRATLGPLEGEHAIAEPADRLTRRLKNDRQSGRLSLDFGFEMNEAQKIEAIRHCAEGSRFIATAVQELHETLSEDCEQMYRLASRSVHYEYRLQRIKTDGVDAHDEQIHRLHTQSTTDTPIHARRSNTAHDYIARCDTQ